MPQRKKAKSKLGAANKWGTEHSKGMMSYVIGGPKTRRRRGK